MTPDQLTVMLERYRGLWGQSRRLVAGAVAWEIIKSALTPEGWAHMDAGPDIVTRLFGMPVHIDPDMPACAWKIVETGPSGEERVVAQHDFAPGFTHAYWDAENRKAYAFNPEPLPLSELKIWEDERERRLRLQRWYLGRWP